MIADGERLKVFLEQAEKQVILCAPFIKACVLQTVLSVVPKLVQVRIFTRWRPIEIAMGVSDLEVLQIALDRPNTELLLLDDLHAKLYLADGHCLVGSANLTASALGWSNRSNIELLIPARSDDSDITFLLQQLEFAEFATSEIRSKIETTVAALDIARLKEGWDMVDESESRRVAWLPRCAAPYRLFEIYRDSETTVVVEGTRQDGLADLKDMQIRSGLSEVEFKASVRNTLYRMPAVSRVLDDVSQGLTDSKGIVLIKESRQDMSGTIAQEQWRILRDWIGVFFDQKFEVAPESFIIRLKSRQ